MAQDPLKQQGEAIKRAHRGPRPYVWLFIALSLAIIAAVFVAMPSRDSSDGVTAGNSQVESARDPASAARTPAVPGN